MSTKEDNGNVGYIKPTSSSNEDLSEYTDADESISAPTEFLAEFLSAVMMKDYVTALKYCKLILQYEPNNAPAKEFYPLILEKLQIMDNEEDADSADESEGEEEEENSSSSSSDSDSSSSDDSSEGQEEDEEEEEEGKVGAAGDKRSKGSSDGDATTGSYSSLEDDEAETADQLAALAAKYKIDNVNLGNGNNIYSTSLPTSFHEEKLANVVANTKTLLAAGMGVAFGTKTVLDNNQTSSLPYGISSDSESPTEPVSQQTVAMLRARVVPN